MKHRSIQISRIIITTLVVLAPVLAVLSWSRQQQLNQANRQFSYELLRTNSSWITDLMAARLQAEQVEPYAVWDRHEGLQGDIVQEFQCPEQDPMLTMSLVSDELRDRLQDAGRLPSGFPIRFAALLDLVRQHRDASYDSASWAIIRQRLTELAGAKDLNQVTLTYIMQRLPNTWKRHFQNHQHMLQLVAESAHSNVWIHFRNDDQRQWFLVDQPTLNRLARDVQSKAPGLSVRFSPNAQRFGSMDANLQLVADPAKSQKDFWMNTVTHGILLMVVELGLLSLWFALLAYARVSRLQKQLLAATSHELRTPLAAIRQLSELLLNRSQPGSQDQDYARHIERESRRLQALVENLLTTARYEQGGIPLRPAPFRLDQLLQDTLDMAQRSAPELAISLDAKRFSVTWDRNAMTQVFTNLIDNARIHAGPRLEIKARPSGDQARIEIRDFGDCMDMDRIQRSSLFNTDPSGRTGLGLGLNLCHQIVTQHGGRMAFELAHPGLRVVLTIPTVAQGAPP